MDRSRLRTATRLILLAAAVAFAAVVLLAALLPYAVSSETGRNAAARALSQSLGRELILDSLEFSWDGTISAGGLAVADLPAFSDKPLLTVKKMGAQFSWGSIAWGKPVFSLTLSGVNLNLVRDKAGASNLNALFSAIPGEKEEKPAARPSSAESRTPEADVKLTVKDLEIRAEDRATGRKLALVGAALEVALDSSAPGAASLSFSSDLADGAGAVRRASLNFQVRKFLDEEQRTSAGRMAVELDALFPGLKAKGSASGGLMKLDAAVSPAELADAARPFLPDGFGDMVFTGEMKIACETRESLGKTPAFSAEAKTSGFTATGGPLGGKILSLPSASLTAAGTADLGNNALKIEKGAAMFPGVEFAFTLESEPAGQNGAKISGALTGLRIDPVRAAKLAAPFAPALTGLSSGPGLFNAEEITFRLSLPEKAGGATVKKASLALSEAAYGPRGRETKFSGLELAIPEMAAEFGGNAPPRLAGDFSVKLGSLEQPGAAEISGLAALIKGGAAGAEANIEKLEAHAARAKFFFNGGADWAGFHALRLEMKGVKTRAGQTGGLEGGVLEKASFSSPGGELNAGGTPLYLGKFALDTSDADISLKDGKLSKTSLNASFDAESAARAGRAPLTARGLSVNFTRLVYENAGGSGQIKADAALSAGSLESPGKFSVLGLKVKTWLEAAPGSETGVRLAGTNIAASSLSLSSGEGTARLEGFLLKAGNLSARIENGEPVRAEISSLWAKAASLRPGGPSLPDAEDFVLDSPRIAWDKKGETHTIAASLKTSASRLTFPGGPQLSGVAQALEADLTTGQDIYKSRGSLTFSLVSQDLGTLSLAARAPGGKADSFTAELTLKGDAARLDGLHPGWEKAGITGGRVRAGLKISGTLGPAFDPGALRTALTASPLSPSNLGTALAFIHRAVLDMDLDGLAAGPLPATLGRPIALSTTSPVILSASKGLGAIKGDVPLSFSLGPEKGGAPVRGTAALSFTLEDMDRLDLTYETTASGGIGGSGELSLTLTGLAGFLENPGAVTPAAVLSGLDGFVSGGLKITAPDPVKLPDGTNFAGKAETSFKLNLKRAEKLTADLALDLGGAELALSGGTLVSLKKASLGLKRSYDLKPGEKTGAGYLSQTVLDGGEKRPKPPARATLAIKTPDRAPEIEIPRLVLKGPAKPLEITKLRLWLKFQDGLPVFDNFAFETLNGSVGGNMAFLPASGGFESEGAVAFSRLDMEQLLPPETARRLRGESETGGSAAFFLPLSEKWGPMTENLRLDAKLTKIGPRALDAVLLSLDPSGTDAAILDQRKLLSTANVEWLGAKVANGFFSLSGGLRIKGISIPMPGVEHVPVNRLGNLLPAGSGPPGMPSLLAALELLYSKELKFRPTVKQ